MRLRARARARPAALTPEQRRGNFDEVVAVLDEDAAVREAERCLGCGVFCESMWAIGSHPRRSEDHSVILTLEVPLDLATHVAGIRVQDPAVTAPIDLVPPPASDDDVVLCRCERVTVGQVRQAVRAGVRDLNQLKAMLKCGLGACGGKTCGIKPIAYH